MNVATSVVQIAHNAVNAKLIDASREVKLAVREALSFVIDGAEYTNAFKKSGGHWDGRSSFFDFHKETFPAGFVYLVQAKLQGMGYRVAVHRKPFPVPLGDEIPVVDTFGCTPEYSYQYEVTRKVLKFGQIIARVATGGGKSRIAKLCYKRIGRKTLFLTTRGVLMYQMTEQIEAMGERPGIIGDSQWNESKGFNAGMVQTLAPLVIPKSVEQELERRMDARKASEDKEVEKLRDKMRRKKRPVEEITDACTKLRDQIQKSYPSDEALIAQVQKSVAEHSVKHKRAIEFLKSVEFVILEEAHESSAEGFYEIMRACSNAHYRLALTATPFMRESVEANMKLMACSGPVAIKVSEKELIERGVLAKPYFKYCALHAIPEMKVELADGRKTTRKLYKSTTWPDCYEIGVVNNDERNRLVLQHVQQAVKYGLSVMILVTHKAHGHLLSKMLQEVGIRNNFIFGDKDQNERKAALLALQDGRIQALIGSSILDVGVDVPAVGMIILAGAGKAEVSLRQRIGRGLRAKKKGPNVALIVDFQEPNNNVLREHFYTRLNIVQHTPGFAENIVQDFDFKALGYSSAG